MWWWWWWWENNRNVMAVVVVLVEGKQFKCGGGGKTIEMWRRARCDYEKEESEGDSSFPFPSHHPCSRRARYAKTTGVADREN